MEEVWKEIPEFHGYEVSTHGRVRSYKCKRWRHSRRSTPKILRTSLSRYGYPTVCLISGRGKAKTCSVHRLVAGAFVYNPDQKPHVNHLDGDKTNNTPSNLEWCTSSENNRHAVKLGLHRSPRGSENHFARLNERDVALIKAWLTIPGVNQPQIAKAFGVSVSTVSLIFKNKIWKHVPLLVDN